MKENKTLQEKLHSRHLKQPPKLIYNILARIWKVMYFKKLGIKIKYNVNPKDFDGAYIVVSNHASRLDYIYTGIAFLPHTLNYVAGYNEFFRSHLAFVFKLLQVIPKKNFTPDIYTLKEISRIIRSGGKVIIFPEGMSSISGANQPCALGGGKLLKHFKVPVLMTKIKGGYLTNTKYCLDERYGKVEVEVDMLFTPKQLETLSADEIQDKLNEVLYHDDYEWNKKEQIKFKTNGRIAHNLHHLLYKCPKCKSEFTMVGEGDKIMCTNCSNGAIMNDYYDLIPFNDDCVIPLTPKVWFDWERENVKELVKDESFEMKQKVKLGVLPKYKYLKDLKTCEVVGEGEITVNRSGFYYDGEKDGKPFSFCLLPKEIPTFGMCIDITNVYTFYKGEYYEFIIENGTTAKWLLAVEEIHRITGGAWQDFKNKEQFAMQEK